MTLNESVYDYDYQNDSLFIYSVESYEYEVSLELDNEVILDLDVGAKPVAFEFLNASKLFKLDKNHFKNLVKICIRFNITEESIGFNIRLDVLAGSRTQVFDINRIGDNPNNIPAMQAILVTV